MEVHPTSKNELALASHNIWNGVAKGDNQYDKRQGNGMLKSPHEHVIVALSIITKLIALL
jgi:hypothetical protein